MSMNIKIILLVFVFHILFPAYSQKILSLHPIFSEQDAIPIPGIEGLWYFPDYDMDLSLQRAGDNFYRLKYSEGDSESLFEALFVKVEDLLFLDLNGILPDNLGDSEYRNSFVNGHIFYKVELKNDSMLL